MDFPFRGRRASILMIKVSIHSSTVLGSKSGLVPWGVAFWGDGFFLHNKARLNLSASAAKTVRGLKWARVAVFEMELDGKKIAEYRAATKICFDVEH